MRFSGQLREFLQSGQKTCIEAQQMRCQVVWMALNDYTQSKAARGKSANFADALIIYKARFIASRQKIRFGGSYTFDVAAQSLPGAKAIN